MKRQLELLAPARDYQIGIAAIDCGADAVYIAGPQFGARQAAGNEIDDIRRLCEYAHRYGVRIFVTLNTILYDGELESAYKQMLAVQEAGADAIIVQDLAILAMAEKGIGNIKGEIRIPLHASTQCAIRTPEQARFLESLGFSRLILERELSLKEIRAIRDAVSCELEFFVHGALCVCYSGQCYLSEKIAGRSANRGACIQACRSRYDLVDGSGKVLVRDKALLSLKDYNLRDRIGELADAGITSFKIEGRLKNVSYVKNVVRDYSIALKSLVSKHSDLYERGSSGTVYGGFTPDTRKTFNRGYTELYIDGKRGRWACMEAAKSMGEEVGTIASLNHDKSSLTVKFAARDIVLANGDGFSFVAKDGSVTGFRGDVCSGTSIKCKSTPSLYVGAKIYRSLNAVFEKELERQACTRRISADVTLSFINEEGSWQVKAVAVTEDGRKAEVCLEAGNQTADNQERMLSTLESQIGKSTSMFTFRLENLVYDNQVPFMPASAINAVRRALAESLEAMPCISKELQNIRPCTSNSKELPQNAVSYKSNVSNELSRTVYSAAGAESIEEAYELGHQDGAELMRTRYCIRYELGMCPKHHGVKDCGPLFLMNNGQKFSLHFDCRSCEMVVK